MPTDAAPTRMPPPSGEQLEIRHGEQRAVIVEVGGGIRAYSVGARAVLDPYGVDDMCPGAHGTPLIPWPNRLGDGRYHFDGTDYQVPLTEPDKRNAIHGFLRWRSWRAVDHGESSVVMGTCLYPLKGYPFLLDVEVAYRLDDDGLTVATTATNRGDQPCPYGSGQHPYLSPGDGLIDDCTVHLDAATRILTDDERQLPRGREPVEGTAYDFRHGKRLGDLELDYPFTDLARDDRGRAWVRLVGTDGASAEIWVDEHYPIVELFSGDTLEPDRRRRGLGTEPMTCPPNAFQSGDHLVRLEPGDSITTSWGARLR
ncbi:MAG TPA: aldose 1-epimerase family protein [Acidimicrobiales bacterium]|nr:aldose 1-epimerase family protein [Acidimicrobiales bacterium]